MRVAVVDYGSGNLRSAAKAVERAARDEGLTVEVLVTDKAEAVAAADRVVLPGVGAFGDCAAGVAAVDGLREALEHVVRRAARPFLGVCVGMQLMATRGLEHGVHAGFGWLPGDIVPLKAQGDPAIKIPHMGWNLLTDRRDHALLAGTAPDAHAYFVHSYVLEGAPPEAVTARALHGAPFTAMIASENMAGCQFHPEKSQAFGLTLIANFLRWSP